MKQEIKIGQTDYTALVLIRDTAGAPKTALTFESAGLDFCYVRAETDNDVVLTDGAPATQTLTGDHSDWGFVKVDDTKAPGLYRLDLPDGVFATGAWSAVVSLIGTGLDPTHLEFILVPESPMDGVKIKSLTADCVTAAGIADDAISSEHLNTGAITADAFAANAIVAATLAADCIAAAKIATGAITNAKFAAGAIDAAAIANDAIDLATFAADVKTGSALKANVETITTGAITAAAIANAAIDNATFAADVGSTALATNVIGQAAAKVWDALRADHATADTFGDIDTSADVADAVWDEATSGHTTGGTFGEQVKTDVDAILADTGTDGVVVASLAAGSITATAIATGAIDADALAADAVDEILDEVVEGSTTFRQALRLLLAALGGKLAGAATTTLTIRDIGDSKNRVSATVDADGNRSAVTLDLT